VTSKEPTLADKKKTSDDDLNGENEPLAATDPSDPETSADTPEIDPETEPSPETDPNAEPTEKTTVTIEGDDEEDEFPVDEEDDHAVRHPSAKEVLNRLLEKNEIILKLNKDNAEKDKQLKDLNEKWLRSVAEFENYRKRSRKEWELLKQQSKTEVILEILSVVDDFERAFSVAEDLDDEFIQGIRLIYNNLVGILGKFGIQEIESLSTSFDPNFHMAVGQLETEDVESGYVAEVIQKGYQLDDTVIRPARVIVAK
jgi:molecular chaperone GrpE